jgi:gamma-glutamylcyclotransferase (GGCT)/AIG2-like uncharacterized protein YtfP
MDPLCRFCTVGFQVGEPHPDVIMDLQSIHKQEEPKLIQPKTTQLSIMATTHNIFVYGTLMTGMSNHVKLVGETPGAVFIGRGVTKEKMKMYAAGVPFVDPDECECAIHGEVWQIDSSSLARIDAFEGHPDWYFRFPVNVKLDGEGEERVIQAEIYANRKFREFGMDTEAVVIESGDFRSAIRGA